MNQSKYELIFHIKAESDHDNAYYWYEIQKEGLGERFLKNLRDKLEQIIDMPVIYGEKSKIGYRQARLKDFPYVVVYKVNNAKKVILLAPFITKVKIRTKSIENNMQLTSLQ